MRSVHQQMPPFRHEFYALAIKADGDGHVHTGEFTNFPEGSTIFFNTPFQTLSWDIAPNWKGYYLIFSQDFIAQSGALVDILNMFPFLKIDQSIPFSIPKFDLMAISAIYESIWREYQGDADDKFKIIEAQVYLLLQHIRRFFEQQVDANSAAKSIQAADIKLLSRYQTLIQSSFYPNAQLETFSNLHSTSYYAQKLSVHPNHLNAIVKSVSGLTALHHIHKHILSLAKSYLAQTDWSVKQIAYSLHFESPNNFSAFFKRKTELSPLEYRDKARL